MARLAADVWENEPALIPLKLRSSLSGRIKDRTLESGGIEPIQRVVISMSEPGYPDIILATDNEMSERRNNVKKPWLL